MSTPYSVRFRRRSAAVSILMVAATLVAYVLLR